MVQQTNQNHLNSLIAGLRLKPNLKELNRAHFADISERVKVKRKELEELQLHNLSHDLRRIEEEHVVHVELVDLEAVESSFYRQKAKIQWIQNGDLGTKLFHSTAIAKKKKNTIGFKHDANGNRPDSFETMVAEMLNFYL
ncbi:hypothetical protein V6N13_092596 [Hibiscus sabdariffa]